jgi:hypothetical protein
MKHPYLHRATEEIDAAIFSGDPFTDPEERAELRRLMARWERGLQEFDRADEEEPE